MTRKWNWLQEGDGEPVQEMMAGGPLEVARGRFAQLGGPDGERENAARELEQRLAVYVKRQKTNPIWSDYIADTKRMIARLRSANQH